MTPKTEKQYKETIKRLEKRLFDFFILSQVGKALISLQDLQDLAAVFVSSVQDAVEAVNASLLIYNPETQTFTHEASVGLSTPAAELREITFKKQEGVLWRLLNGGEPFMIMDSSGQYRFHDMIKKAHLDLLESQIWVPLMVNKGLRGVLALGEKKDGEPYDHGETVFIAHLANQAAIAIDIAMTDLQKKKASVALQKKMENLSVLYDVSKALNFTNNFRNTLLLILDKSRNAVKAQKGSIMLLNKETNELELMVARGIDELTDKKLNAAEIATTKIKVGEGVAGKVAKTKKTIVLDNTKEDERFLPSVSSNVSNIICLPLVVNNECIGVMNITNKQNNEKFTEEDIELLSTLAGQVAITINNANLYNLAITDGLTHFFIKRYFDQVLYDELLRAKRYGRPLSVIMIDIDDFKMFNDRYGHQQGDVILAATASLFRQTIRETDTPCRYGGEEFMFLLPEADAAKTGMLAERMRKIVEEHSYPGLHGEPLKVTVSLGIASFPADAERPDDLIKKADLALYKAKTSGKNRIVLYSPRLES
ncbi:MAG TPA: sensor domain-containing diguanylate cyclase [Verrucomicrobiae bacterium]|jgi:diguanylate cyclase (GGDEF)-like protein|nr:sensor domain-containing diguanylate cyclase [Verrucomicrobiae bacterium]